MRAIHARVLFLLTSLTVVVGVVLVSRVLLPYLRDLNRTTEIANTIIKVKPVPVDPIYERDCQVTGNQAITGYIVNNPIAVDNSDECRRKCQAHNDSIPDDQLARCDYYSYHSSAAVARANAGLDPLLDGEEDQKCHFISGLSAITKTPALGSYSGANTCQIPPSCLLTMNGIVRTGDTMLFPVTSPAECEAHCLDVNPLECLYWSLTSSNTINQFTTVSFDRCILHRATKPSVSGKKTDDDVEDSWPIQTRRATAGQALLSGRVCSTDYPLNLNLLQNEVYELYGMEAPNKDGPDIDLGGSGDKFEPSQEELNLWFYDNNEFDGGPFPVDPFPAPITASSQQNSSCTYGLSKTFADDSLVEFLNAPDFSLEVGDQVILTHDPFGQGHIQPFTEQLIDFKTLKLPDIIAHATAESRNDALWVISLNHLPVGCGVRRSIKLRSESIDSEVVVMDSSNFQDYYTMGLKTSSQCDMSLPYLMDDLWHPFLKPQQRGAFSRYKENEEDSRQFWNCMDPEGCAIESRIWRDGAPDPIFGGAGMDYNLRGGGVLVIQVDRSRAIKIWDFAPEDVPFDLINNAPEPDEWALKPTRTISGEEKYLVPHAWFPFQRGCEAQANCEEADVLQCPQYLDNCEDYMKDIHTSIVFSVDAAGQNIYTEEIVQGYHPVGCHGYKNFQSLSLEFSTTFCDEESTTAWARDEICSVLSPLTQTGDGSSLADQCIIQHEELGGTLLSEAYWSIYEIRLYENNSTACFHESAMRTPPIGFM